jgi:hypothetical protein
MPASRMHQMRNEARDITMALVFMARIRIMLAPPWPKDDVVVITRDESACTRATVPLSTAHYACVLPRSLMLFAYVLCKSS